MTYKEFSRWCNDRACDGYWGLTTAMACIEVIRIMQSTPFWRRKKKWEEFEQYVVANFVNPTNEKIREHLRKLGVCEDNSKEENNG